MSDRRSAADIARMIRDPQGTVPGTMMPTTPMPPETLELIVRYLARDAGGAGAPAQRAPDPPSVGTRRAGREARGPATLGGPPRTPRSLEVAAEVQPSRPTPDQNDASRPASTYPPGTRPPLALYARFCAPCHGAAGKGDGPNARFLPVPPAVHADGAAMARRSDDRLFDAIYAGGYVLDRSNLMPAFGETLTRAEIWELVRYIRTLCRCVGPAWSRDVGK